MMTGISEIHCRLFWKAGGITASLQMVDGLDATYGVHLTLPVNFATSLYENHVLQLSFAGEGVLAAGG